MSPRSTAGIPRNSQNSQGNFPRSGEKEGEIKKENVAFPQNSQILGVGRDFFREISALRNPKCWGIFEPFPGKNPILRIPKFWRIPEEKSHPKSCGGIQGKMLPSEFSNPGEFQGKIPPSEFPTPGEFQSFSQGKFHLQNSQILPSPFPSSGGFLSLFQGKIPHSEFPNSSLIIPKSHPQNSQILGIPDPFPRKNDSVLIPVFNGNSAPGGSHKSSSFPGKNPTWNPKNPLYP